ncbi:MAG: 16S rRNA (guanine(966)-N(2))-methyltransferase RsmD [Hornefia sp.]|nr:16S rRNA (guanine(966)-N(2))-methyltransferase RsmD [Hornefia sp.]
MRIITGEYRGRKLETPAGYDIRPTSDKVRESIFNLLMNDTYENVFCDLFTGTGSLGLEALSRGAKLCYFCDKSRDSIGIAKRNIKHCGAEDRAVVLQGDFTRNLNRIREKIDVFLLDPPYGEGLYERCLEIIENLDLLAVNGIIIAEHGSHDEIPERVGKIVRVRRRRYGKTTVSIYRNEADLTKETEESREEF